MINRAMLGWTAAVLTAFSASAALRANWSGTAEASPALPYGRTGVEVCVEVSPELKGTVAPNTAAQRVKVAADSASMTSAGAATGLDLLKRSVVPACPHGYVAPSADAARNGGDPPVRGRVDQPMKISTLVFVVGDSATLRLGPSGFARTAYESVCEDAEVCREVTTALFVSRAVLESPDQLRSAMVVGLGIDPTGGKYPNGHPPEADGSKK